MGRDKAWIDFQGRPLIERVIAKLRPVCQEIVLVSSNDGPYASLPVRLVGDVFRGKGSLGGIYSGLKAAKFERAVLVGCDMPFLNEDLLDYLISISPDYDVVIPSGSAKLPSERFTKVEGRNRIGERRTAKDDDLHPLHAVYSNHCVEAIEARLQVDDLRMIGFHPNVRVRIVGETELERFDPDHLSLFNVNTPEDLAIAVKLAAKEHASHNDQC